MIKEEYYCYLIEQDRLMKFYDILPEIRVPIAENLCINSFIESSLNEAISNKIEEIYKEEIYKLIAIGEKNTYFTKVRVGIYSKHPSLYNNSEIRRLLQNIFCNLTYEKRKE